MKESDQLVVDTVQGNARRWRRKLRRFIGTRPRHYFIITSRRCVIERG
ncbi:MAG: hypothetical protein HFH23_04665 [Ruminococcus sp.]|nr:hypothetical protein [Ruminococcus sp.]